MFPLLLFSSAVKVNMDIVPYLGFIGSVVVSFNRVCVGGLFVQMFAIVHWSIHKAV